jgi:hypothetical protein
MAVEREGEQARKPHGAASAALHATLFLAALCTLLLEVLLTRLLSVVMWYHFTFAVISFALLGIAAGAIRCYRQRPPPDPRSAAREWTTISRGLAFFALAALAPLALMRVFVATPTFSAGGLALLLVYFAACAAPFYASGYVTATVFRFGAPRASSLYAADLLGASVGCVLSIPLLDRIGGTQSLLVVSIVSSVASWIAARQGHAPGRRALALGGIVVFGAALVVPLSSARVDLRTVKLSLREELRPILAVKWNSHSRLAVLDYFDPGAPSPFPFLAWGLSDRYQGWLPRQYLITIDGASETPITELKEDIRAHEYLAHDITALPYHLRPGTKTLIIGAGGGRDVLTALRFGSTDVTGVELNRDIVEFVRDRYASFAGGLYARPGVRIEVDDGRNFVRRARDRYDVLQISMIDTFAATAAGAYTLSENNLYTAEAFDEYLDHLTADGILSINRFFLDPPQQTLRIVTLAREALARRGVRDPGPHIAVLRKGDRLGDNGLVMVKVAPFTPGETETLLALSSSLGFEPVVVPGRPAANAFGEFLAAPAPASFYQRYPFDVRPPTDDRPFFFNTLKVSALLDAVTVRTRMDPFRVYNFDAVFILFVLLASSVLFLLAFIFLPLVGGRRHAVPGAPARLRPGALAYFVLVGLGFILVEIVLIQRFHLYLGHPVYSLAVVLFTLLAASGLGSAWTARSSERHVLRYMATGCAAALALIVVHQLLWPSFLGGTLGLPRWTRIGLASLSLIPMGIAMGVPYPLALRAVSASRPDALPWAWAVNAGASVVGSILAFALAMAAGFSTVLLVGALCYASALGSAVLAFRANPSGSPERA